MEILAGGLSIFRTSSRTSSIVIRKCIAGLRLLRSAPPTVLSDVGLATAQVA